MMDKKEYINNIDYLPVDRIAEGILSKVVTMQELRDTGNFDAKKQKLVKKKLKEQEDDIFSQANTITKLEEYLKMFPKGVHENDAQRKIREINEREQKRNEALSRRETVKDDIRRDVNSISVSEVLDLDAEIGGGFLEELCSEVGIDANIIRQYREVDLPFGETPLNKGDIIKGHTDVFFWGIPSSGKTTALSAILNTIKTKYAMESPNIKKLFGGKYRDTLANIFLNGWGNLPGGTVSDFTQYMPFVISKRNGKSKHKLSFFELSGELFRSIHDRLNGAEDSEDSVEIQESWKTLKLLLDSDNKKIHFFFIDYKQQQSKGVDGFGLTQTDYLNAATGYFNSHLDIFRQKTDAVYVVITKADEIQDENTKRAAEEFLETEHGGFMSVLKNKCRSNGIPFGIKLFSIGDVYFKRICKINRAYSEGIIETLFDRIPKEKKKGFFSFFNFFNG